MGLGSLERRRRTDSQYLEGAQLPAESSRPEPRLHIVFVNQFFWPDIAPTGALLEDTARHLAEQGHKVTIICGQVGYGEEQTCDPPPVKIVRVRNLRFSRQAGGRVLSWLTFLMASTWRLFWLRKVDVLVPLTTPPGLSVPSAVLSGLLGAKLWIWEMDLYPDIAVATGMVKESLLLTVLRGVFNWSRRRADGIIAIGDCMRERIVASGVDAAKIHVIHTWADGSRFPALPMTAGPPGTPLSILYSGNLGVAHDTGTVLEAMTQLAKDDWVHFVFAGGGSARAELATKCAQNGVRNVTFPGYGNEQEFAANLAACHVGLVTLRDGCEGTVVPSKIYALLASGRPILFVGPAGATPARIIADHACGWHVIPGDAAGLVALLKRLRAAPEELLFAGMAARRAFEANYDISIKVNKMASMLSFEGKLRRRSVKYSQSY